MQINEDKIQKLLGWTPHVNQKKILDCQAKEINICAGRRFGKSEVAAYLGLKELLNPQNITHTWIIAPTYDLTNRVFEKVVKWFLKLHPKQSGAIAMRPIPSIRLPHGSFIEGKSIENPAGLLGQELDLAIMDEAARFPRNIWESYLSPSLVTRNGKSVKISTPIGKNWFWENWLQSKQEDGAFTFKTTDNPYWHIGHDACGDRCEPWEKIRATIPERIINQEYLALFEESARVFIGVRDIVSETEEDVKEGRYYIMGVDLGKYRDWTVITIIDKRTHNVVRWERFQGPYSLQKGRISGLARLYKARVLIDSTGQGDPILEDLQREGIVADGFKFTNTSKQQLIEKLASFIEQRAISIPPKQELLDELDSFGYQLTDKGHVQYGAPIGLHDDCVISLALAVWGLSDVRRRTQSLSMHEASQKRIDLMLSPQEITPKRTIRGYSYV